MKKIFLLIYCLTALGIAQIKISDLPHLTVGPDSMDLIVIVDVSADTTKSISFGVFMKQLTDRIETLQNLNDVQTSNINNLTYNQSVILDSLQKIVDLINSFLPDQSPLADPVLASVTADNDSSFINLVFSSNVNADSTVIQRSTYAGGYLNKDTVNENETSYKDSTTLGNTIYYYRLYSYNTNAVSGYSSVLSATTVDTASIPEVIANYYMDATSGNDSWSGTTPGTAWKTLNKLNLMIPLMQSGDTIAFKKGEIFNGNLTIARSGISLISYGSGLKPIIYNLQPIGNALNAADWEVYSGNVYVTTEAVTNFDDQARRIFNSTDFDEIGTISNDIGSLSATQSWYYDGSKLYHYNASAPAVWATQWYSPYSETSNENIISATNKDYVTIDGLDIRGGQETVLFTDCDNLTIKNSDIKYSNRYGFVGYNCNYVTIRKDTIDRVTLSGWDFDIDNFGYTNSDGIYLSGSYGSIDSNYIAGWVHSGIHLEGDNRYPYYLTTYNNVFYNYVTSPTNYGRGIEFVCWGTDGSYMSNNRVYNNLFHQISAANQFCGDSNYVYFNIFDSTVTRADQTIGESDAVRLSPIPTTPSGASMATNLFFFNNTVHYSSDYTMSANDEGGTNILNNMFINPRQASYHGGNQGLSAIVIGNLNHAVKNNIIFSIGKTTNDYMFNVNSLGYKLNDFNNLTAIDGNIQETAALINILNILNWNAAGVALNSGVNISGLVPVGFRDRQGNLVDTASPNLGAIDN